VQPGTGSGKIQPSAGRTHDAPGYKGFLNKKQSVVINQSRKYCFKKTVNRQPLTVNYQL
jgi:hypothetical protein